MLHKGAILPEGKWCENAICRILSLYGIKVQASTPYEDHRLKVDFWVRFEAGGAFLPIQFTTNREAVVSSKGTTALTRGVIPSWIAAEVIETAVETGDGSAVVSQFQGQVNSILTKVKGLKLLTKWV